MPAENPLPYNSPNLKRAWLRYLATENAIRRTKRWAAESPSDEVEICLLKDCGVCSVYNQT